MESEGEKETGDRNREWKETERGKGIFLSRKMGKVESLM